ncbi:H-type lectin domain-containing protein [Silvibacterium acidisoli]|uniref:H-type lectin domain-containing protein n=1 Tax=Acidobacteriaceae bacterium ZG23-2 TaxID=2883246 RepID=UPI00406C2952
MTCSGTLHVDSKDFKSEGSFRREPDSPAVFHITFSKPFPQPPSILLSLTGFSGGGEAFRFRFEPINITEAGFDIQLSARRSWIDSLDISWLAMEG